jgi:hypothetical protein
MILGRILDQRGFDRMLWLEKELGFEAFNSASLRLLSWPANEVWDLLATGSLLLAAYLFSRGRIR